MIKFFRLCWRIPAMLALLLSGIVIAYVWLPADPARFKARHWQSIRLWHRLLLAILGVRVKFYPCHTAPVNLFVANHISWLDIPVISAFLDTGFVAKAELSQWPFIGKLCTRGGSIFIMRGGSDAAKITTHHMIKRLQQGQSILIFPEGTTTIGESVRVFHSRLFEAAVQTEVRVQPLALRYLDCPEAPFIGDDVFFPHLLRLLARASTEAELIQLPSIHPLGLARKELALHAHRAVTTTIVSDTSFETDLDAVHAGFHGVPQTPSKNSASKV